MVDVKMGRIPQIAVSVLYKQQINTNWHISFS
jgi:hypothetical protein